MYSNLITRAAIVQITKRPQLWPRVSSLLPSPCAAPQHPPPEHHSSCQISFAAYVPKRTQSLPVSPKMATAAPETPPPQFHPLHSTRKATPRPSSSLPAPTANTGNAASILSRNPAASVWTNPTLLDSMRSAQDRLTDTESACAYPLARAVPELTHPQIPPSSAPWTARAPPPRSAPGARQTAIAPQSL